MPDSRQKRTYFAWVKSFLKAFALALCFDVFLNYFSEEPFRYRMCVLVEGYAKQKLAIQGKYKSRDKFTGRG